MPRANRRDTSRIPPANLEKEVGPEAGRLHPANLEKEVGPEAGRLHPAFLEKEVGPEAGRVRKKLHISILYSIRDFFV